MKDFIKAVGGFLAILTIGYLILIFSDSSDNIKVDGHDAVKIAWHHLGYVISVAIAAAVSVAVAVIGIEKQLHGGSAVLAGLLTGLFFALMVFTKPVNIKTDPISSGITTEEINYLKSKGLQDSNK